MVALIVSIVVMIVLTTVSVMTFVETKMIEEGTSAGLETRIRYYEESLSVLAADLRMEKMPTELGRK